jgi:hypothetical protein
MLRRPQGDGYSFASGGDGFSGMELSLKNRFYCSGLP